MLAQSTSQIIVNAELRNLTFVRDFVQSVAKCFSFTES